MGKIRIFSICSFLYFFCSIPLFALIKAPPEKAILPNGLRVLVVEDHSLPIAAAVMVFNVGRGCGTTVTSGLIPVAAKILSEADTKASTRFDLNDRLEKQGCSVFFDSNHNGIYISCSGPENSLNSMLEYIKSAGFELKVSQERLDSAKAETQRNGKERQRFPLTSGYLAEKARSILFPGKALSISDYPAESEIAKFTVSQVDEFFQKEFVPNNAVLVIVGSVNLSETIKQVMGTFGSIPASAKDVQIPAPKTLEESNEFKREIREYLDIKRTQIFIAFEAPSTKDPDMPATELWETALGFANNSWFDKFLAKEFPSLQNNVSAKYSTYQDEGVFALGIECDNPDVDHFIETLLRELGNLWMFPPKNEELQRLVTTLKSKTGQANEQRRYLASDLAASELTKSYVLSTSLVSAFERVTPEDMQRVARRIFSGGKYAVVIAHPMDQQGKGTTKILDEKLRNGLRLIVKPYAGSEVIGAGISLNLYSIEPKGKEGISKLLAAYLEEASSGETKDNVSKELDSIGGAIQFYFFDGCLRALARGAKTEMGKLFPLIQKVTFEPIWDQKRFESTVRKLKNFISSQKESPFMLLYDKFIQEAFKDSPFVESERLFNHSIEAISLEDLKAFHNKFAEPGNCICTIVGNVDPTVAFKDASGALGEFWGTSASSTIRGEMLVSGPFKPLSQILEFEIKVPASKETAFLAVGFPLPPIPQLLSSEETRNDFAVNSTVNHLLSWSRNGIIKRELIDCGLAQDFIGDLYASTSKIGFSFFALKIPINKLDDAKAALKKILDKIQTMDISESDIETARKILESYMVQSIERSSVQASVLTSFIKMGLGNDFIEIQPKLFRAITPNNVKTGINRYFKNYLLITGKPE